MHRSSAPTLAGLCQVTDSLFLSNGRVANDDAVLSKFYITCIVNATEKLRPSSSSTSEVEHVHVAVTDSPLTNLTDHFDVVADKIQSVELQHGRTLVHCNAGVSRSATLCIVYLMKYRNMTLLEAYAFLKSCRPIVRPNNGFWRQLIQYEFKLRGSATVKMVSSSLGEIPDIYEEDTKNMVPF